MSEPWPPFRVLCVDDNRDCADSAALLLKIVGFDAKACYDGESALKLTEQYHPSVVLLDLNMPGMDGDEVANRLKEESWCPLVLVALTARDDEDSRNRTKEAGFHLHLLKPVDPENLIIVLNELMQRASDVSSPDVASG